jgi:hypothetical protein
LHAQLVIPQPGKENRKTGPIPTAYVARESCPSSCPLLGNGCYAETGNIGLHWGKMKGVPRAKFCLIVAEKLGPRQLWRYAVAGDLPGFGGLIDRAALQLLTTANMRRPVIAYTRKPVLDGEHPAAASNRRFIAEAIEGGLMLNLSDNNPSHADALAALDLAPVVTILPNAYARRHRSLGRGKREWMETIGEYRDRFRSCRHIHRQDDASRCARRATPIRPEKRAEHVLMAATGPLLVSQRTVAGVSSKRPPLPAT